MENMNNGFNVVKELEVELGLKFKEKGIKGYSLFETDFPGVYIMEVSGKSGSVYSCLMNSSRLLSEFIKKEVKK